jgi:hypothetical protein
VLVDETVFELVVAPGGPNTEKLFSQGGFAEVGDDEIDASAAG